MWRNGWRDRVWATLDQPWDIVVIGGGITGAGIVREARRLGLQVLMIEQRDFAWGTSSRSSKLVHGGLRYLAAGQFSLTRASVRERQRMLAEASGLVNPLRFLIPTYAGEQLRHWTSVLGLTLYDAFARHWAGHSLNRQTVRLLAPHIKEADLAGGLQFIDAQTDDARLVLRIIREAVQDGATALNYATATSLIHEAGAVVGITIRDEVAGREQAVRAQVVINATGAYVDTIRKHVNAPPRMRPLRGSHLLFTAWRLPVAQALSFTHPGDGRPVFVLPWEGATIVGTTDLDHLAPLDTEPGISPAEVAYLLSALNSFFPTLNLGVDDIVSTWSGVRPVVRSSATSPSKESREHVVWNEQGLLTVTGGKLTTFRLIAYDALNACRAYLPQLPEIDATRPTFDVAPAQLAGSLGAAQQQRLRGRYGCEAAALVDSARPNELRSIAGLPTLWAELRWAAQAEGVVHLDDLLLRRVRIGLLLPAGAAALLPAVREICQSELGWDDARWAAEEARYRAIIAQSYSVPAMVPEWRSSTSPLPESRGRLFSPRKAAAVVALALAAGAWRRRRSVEISQ